MAERIVVIGNDDANARENIARITNFKQGDIYYTKKLETTNDDKSTLAIELDSTNDEQAIKRAHEHAYTMRQISFFGENGTMRRYMLLLPMYSTQDNVKKNFKKMNDTLQLTMVHMLNHEKNMREFDTHDGQTREKHNCARKNFDQQMATIRTSLKTKVNEVHWPSSLPSPMTPHSVVPA